MRRAHDAAHVLVAPAGGGLGGAEASDGFGKQQRVLRDVGEQCA